MDGGYTEHYDNFGIYKGSSRKSGGYTTHYDKFGIAKGGSSSGIGCMVVIIVLPLIPLLYYVGSGPL
jgi:hypothetical protein